MIEERLKVKLNLDSRIEVFDWLTLERYYFRKFPVLSVS